MKMYYYIYMNPVTAGCQKLEPELGTRLPGFFIFFKTDHPGFPVFFYTPKKTHENQENKEGLNHLSKSKEYWGKKI